MVKTKKRHVFQKHQSSTSACWSVEQKRLSFANAWSREETVRGFLKAKTSTYLRFAMRQSFQQTWEWTSTYNILKRKEPKMIKHDKFFIYTRCSNEFNSSVPDFSVNFSRLNMHHFLHLTTSSFNTKNLRLPSPSEAFRNQQTTMPICSHVWNIYLRFP